MRQRQSYEKQAKRQPQEQDEEDEEIQISNFQASVPEIQVSKCDLKQPPKFPSGLFHRLVEAKSAHPLRIWVIDNSGSMLESDGHELRNVGKGEFVFVPCTRWQELKTTVIYHAKLAATMKAATMFRLINNPGPWVGPQMFSIAMDHPSKNTASILEQDLNLAISVIEKTQPNGGTPLLQHLQEIRTQIEAMEMSLRNNSQSIVLVLATDGLPSDIYGDPTDQAQNDFILQLKALQSLPVWIVVRLCTDDPEIVDFYNGLDAQLELPLEVIDDFYGEAREIQRTNAWLNYNLLLHRCREMGYHHRLFDLLDERLLNKDELREFLGLLFDDEAIHSFPDPHGDWKGFVACLSKLIANEDQHHDPLTNLLTPWINIKQLKKCYKDFSRRSGCGLRSIFSRR